jgi:sortase A
VLRRALGHLPRSARPGEDGNIVLAGHRDTFFRALEGVQVGEELQLDSAAGRDHYRVEWAAVVEPRQIAITQPSGYPALTLVTCYPFHYIGSAPYRFVVRARRDGGDGPVLRAAG